MNTKTNNISLFGGNKFISSRMVERDNRLGSARANAERCNRELKRDRCDLERKERLLLQQIKALVLKGEISKAKMLAGQVARYQQVSDKNFAGSVYIQTRAQLMFSNHKINRAEVEALKGAKYANMGESLEACNQRYEKYSMRLEVTEDMEELMNEGMDEIYEEGHARHSIDPDSRTIEEGNVIDSIIRQAMDPNHHRESVSTQAKQLQFGETHIHLHRYNPEQPRTSEPGVTVGLSTLDLSIDMLRRQMASDVYTLRQLHLYSPPKTAFENVFGSTKPFKIGKLEKENGSFEELPFDSSLQSLGLKSGDHVWICSDD